VGLANSSPQPFRPQSVTDAVESPRVLFNVSGSMFAMTNLIPDPTTQGVFTCRPAAELETEFAGFNTPAFVPVFHVSGSLIYGMVGTALVPGRDQPFCFDTSTGLFVVVGGTQDATTLPLSQATTGTWTPPTMDLVGDILLVTHPGFPGGAGAFFGWFDLSVPGAPTWNAGNTTTNPLTAVPTAVAQFSQRAWFAVGNSIVFSDALNPTVVTLANQVLTTNDNTPVTALAGMPLSTPITGGVIAALLVFKSVESIYQITGDTTTKDLALQALNVSSGTLAPNSITPTPKGVAFISPEGMRLIDFQMNVSDPIGVAGSGVTVPFIYALDPTRMCAAYNCDTIRVSVKNGRAIGTPWEEWWYHIPRQCWTGPHTFPASFIHATVHPSGGDHPSFIMAPQGVLGQLYDSHGFPPLNPTYVENGVQMSFVFQTSVLPDTYQMSETNIVEQTINLALPAGETVTALALDQDAVVLDTTQIVGGTPTVWGAFTWGVSPWFGASSNYRPRQIEWTEGITFRMLAVKLTGLCAGSPTYPLQVGTLYSRYNQLGYLQQEVP
jgi:hypothetical protein